MKIDSIGWVFQFCIFINQEAWILLISLKTRLKSAVLILNALISLICRINKLGGWNNILCNLIMIKLIILIQKCNFVTIRKSPSISVILSGLIPLFLLPFSSWFQTPYYHHHFLQANPHIFVHCPSEQSGLPSQNRSSKVIKSVWDYWSQ